MMLLLKNILRKNSTTLLFSIAKCSSKPVISLENDTLNSIKVKYGQPHFRTHPHILQKGELTALITPNEYKERRHKLLQAIQKFSINVQNNLKNHAIVIPSASKKYMSDKIPYVFRQNTDFLYLSGCLEPDSVLLLTINEKGQPKSVLFLRPKDENSEMWDGPRTGPENAVQFFGVDESYSTLDFRNIIEKLAASSYFIWYDESDTGRQEITNELESLPKSNTEKLKSPKIFVQSLRLIKSENEIELMRKACKIAGEAINETINETVVGDSEHQIFARIDYKCRMKNADYLAYPPVVAAGTNATIIHYINNTQVTKNNDLVLVDAGCEYGGYSSDITRTWPVNRKFTNSQKILYDVILTVQTELIDTLLKPGGESLDKLFDTMCFKLGKYLQEIGLISKDLTGVSLAKASYSFCPHHVSHYLGMDVHDTPMMSRSTNLKPGMICTVEPGIYINLDRMDVPIEFRGLGVRIEDDVLIKSDGVEVLTKNCFKNVDDVENLNLRNS